MTEKLTSSVEERHQEFGEYRTEQFNEICQNVADEQFKKLREAKNAFRKTFSNDYVDAQIANIYTPFANK